MKSLQAFWHWFDGESPTTPDAMRLSEENLSEVANDAIIEAAVLVHDRSVDEEGLANNAAYLAWCLDAHPEALRDLSLSLCAALEKMREQVPEAPKVDDVFHNVDRGVDERHREMNAGGMQKMAVVRASRWAGKSLAQRLAEAGNELPGRPLTAVIYEMAKAQNDQLYRREYLGEWARGPRNRCWRTTEVPDGFECLECMSTPCRRIQLAKRRHEHQGEARWSMDHVTETLTVYAEHIVAREQADRMRGMSPRLVMIEGSPGKCDHGVLSYLLHQVLAPIGRAMTGSVGMMQFFETTRPESPFSCPSS